MRRRKRSNDGSDEQLRGGRRTHTNGSNVELYSSSKYGKALYTTKGGDVKTNQANITLAVANLFGAIFYLRQASEAWLEPGLGPEDIAGEPIVWAVRAVPVFLLFLIANTAWGVLMLARPQWRSERFYSLAWLIWIIAIGIDFSHHG